MAKRATASALLQAGRKRPPRNSPPEQPVIPPTPPAVNESASQSVEQAASKRGDWSTSELDVQGSSGLVAEQTSEVHAASTSRLDDKSPGEPVNQHRRPSSDETTSQPVDTLTDANSHSTRELVAQPPTSPTNTPKATSPLGDQLATPPGDESSSQKPVTKAAIGATSSLDGPLSGVHGVELPSPPVVQSSSELVTQESNDPVVLTTSRPVDVSATESVGQSPAAPADRTTSERDRSAVIGGAAGGAARPGELSPPRPDDDSADGRPVAEMSTASVVTEQPRSAPKPPSRTTPDRKDAVDPPAATSSLIAEATGKYERLTVFLTPAQRQWLKRTGRQLPVEGLSVSDIVRLAVNRLNADVAAGLPLLDELTRQAYGEAETMAGRRNRGLPPA